MKAKPPTKKPPLDLQQLQQKLVAFWARQGCLLLPACDFTVPAGMMHPQVFFGVLSETSWRSVVLQPARRPADGRQGVHPYRLVHHLQVHVVLKAPPKDLRRLYLQSLEKGLGLRLADHDLCFAEGKWQVRSLAARGAGWNVRLDGLGVTRMTFLQQLGGIPLDPVSVEVVYGVERLALVLHGERRVDDLPWVAKGPSYGELHRGSESQQALYAYEVADVGYLRGQLDDWEREAQRCLTAGLPRPAYELAIRGLQTVDVLEARGDVTDLERTEILGRIEAVVRRAVALQMQNDSKKDTTEAEREPEDG